MVETMLKEVLFLLFQLLGIAFGLIDLQIKSQSDLLFDLGREVPGSKEEERKGGMSKSGASAK